MKISTVRIRFALTLGNCGSAYIMGGGGGGGGLFNISHHGQRVISARMDKGLDLMGPHVVFVIFLLK